jgi:hypothetical protein
MAAKATLTGDKELIANMRRAYNSVGGAALDANMKLALVPMRDETANNARAHRQNHTPIGGHLDEGVVIARQDARGPLYRVYWVSFAKRARKIAHLLEFGTAPHWQPHRHMMHPGARPFPFFRPAFEATKQETVETVAKTAWQRIATAVKGTYG